jgi:hypothetical protein
MPSVETRVDNYRVVSVEHNLRPHIDFALTHLGEHLKHVVAAAAELTRPEADPDDVLG